MIAYEDVDITIKKDNIVEELMMSKGVYLLVAQPKIGKSNFALQLSCALTIGSKFLNLQVIQSPVLYITTETNIEQLCLRIKTMNLKPKNKALCFIDGLGKKINILDIEYQLASFYPESKTKLLVIDMLKDLDLNIQYDINDYQDVAQKLMPKIRQIAIKYNFTILLIHHLNKRKETLGSTGLDACVDGIFTMIDKNDNNHIIFKTSNRNFPPLNLVLERNNNLIFKVCQETLDDITDKNLIQFIKYAITNVDFKFTCTEIIKNANLYCTPKKFGMLLKKNLKILENEGLHITKSRDSKSRMYHCIYEEPIIK